MSQTFNADSATVYNVPGVTNATLANFAVGNKVSVSTVEVTTNGTTVQTAQRMNLIPAKPVKTVRTGTVTAYTAGSSITIQDKAGNSLIFTINTDTKISYMKGTTTITVGDRVTINAGRNPADRQFTAKSIRDFGVKKTKNDKNNANQNGQGKGNGKNNNK
jgi:allophanate hydrolase subunit 2